MKALVLVFSVLAASVATAQDRRSELDRAYDEARAAYQALKDAEARRDKVLEPESDERQSTASGSTQPAEQFRGRPQLLQHDVDVARSRYDAALKRWNDLK